MRLSISLLLLLAFAPPAPAVVHDLQDGSANTTPPADDPGFANIGDKGGLSVVYLGHGWVLTAKHVPIGEVDFGDMFDYPPVPNSKIQLQAEWPETMPPDLAVWRLKRPWPNLPPLTIREDPLTVSIQNPTPVTMIGNGADRTGSALACGLPGYSFGGAHTIRWGTNHVEALSVFSPGSTQTRVFESNFDCLCNPGAAGSTEAIAVNGDSGGGGFIKNAQNAWELAGIMIASSACASSTVTTVNTSFTADLSVYRDQILELTAPVIPAIPLWGLPVLGALLLAAGRASLPRRPRPC